MDLGLEGGFIAHRGAVGHHREYIAENLSEDWVRLQKTRLKTVFANDIFTEAKRAWDAYRYCGGGIESVYKLSSIVDLVRKHEQGVSVFPEDIDVVTGGFPCQDFSVAGKRLGFNSNVSHTGERMQGSHCGQHEEGEASRGMLYHWMKRVIDIVCPKLFIAENVKGLVSLGDVLYIIRSDFSSAAGGGYIVVPPQVLNAADYGVAQMRERVLFIGFRRDALRPGMAEVLESDTIPSQYSPYPSPTHSYTGQGTEGMAPLTVREVFKHLKEPSESDDLSQQYFSKAKFLAKGQGQKEVNLSGVGMTIRSEHHGNIEFRRLSSANGGAYLDELNAGLIERRMTPRECALIQSFPPDFPFVRLRGDGARFDVSPSAAYKMIGNAVPPVLAYHLGRRLDSLWDVYFK